MSEHTHVTEIGVRYRDLDPVNHVNNAVYASYVEQARIDYFRAALDHTLASGEAFLAHLSIDFERPIPADADTVVVGASVTEMGTSSITHGFEIRTDDRVAATAESVFVTVDPDEQRPRPIPEEWRAGIEAYERGSV